MKDKRCVQLCITLSNQQEITEKVSKPHLNDTLRIVVGTGDNNFEYKAPR